MNADPNTPTPTSLGWSPWLRLFRLPNLLTVPGDPLAGFLLASGGRLDRSMLIPMLAMMGASVCLYLFGLVHNDIVDLETDRAERPDRPLPSGQITMAQAKIAAFVMALLGIGLASIMGWGTLGVASLLALVICSYNSCKSIYTMGLCRALSLHLGVTASVISKPVDFVTGDTATIALVAIFAYTVAFSAVAKNEMAAEKPMGLKRWMPFVALLVTLPCILLTLGQTEGAAPTVAPTVFVILMCMVLMWSWMLGGMLYSLQPVTKTVAGHIRNLLLVQACLCVAAGDGDTGLFPALFLFALWILFPRLAKRFYSS